MSCLWPLVEKRRKPHIHWGTKNQPGEKAVCARLVKRSRRKTP